MFADDQDREKCFVPCFLQTLVFVLVQNQGCLFLQRLLLDLQYLLFTSAFLSNSAPPDFFFPGLMLTWNTYYTPQPPLQLDVATRLSSGQWSVCGSATFAYRILSFMERGKPFFSSFFHLAAWSVDVVAGAPRSIKDRVLR